MKVLVNMEMYIWLIAARMCFEHNQFAPESMPEKKGQFDIMVELKVIKVKN